MVHCVFNRRTEEVVVRVREQFTSTRQGLAPVQISFDECETHFRANWRCLQELTCIHDNSLVRAPQDEKGINGKGNANASDNERNEEGEGE